MWTRSLKSKRILGSLALQRSGSTVLQLRQISTNSAIHRGIRKSHINPKYADRIKPPTRPNAPSNRRLPESLRRRDSELRPRRPNHASHQDVEDVEEASRQGRSGVNERLERYKRGGRAKPNVRAGVSRDDRGTRRGEPRGNPGFLKDIINGQTRGRRGVSYDDGREIPNQEENRYRTNSELDVESLSRQVRSRSKEFQIDRRSGAEPPGPKRNHRETRVSFYEGAYSGNSPRDVKAGPTSRSGDERNLRYQRATDATASAPRTPRGTPTPVSIPYTTPASEFLYGSSVVMAALKARRRTFYKLYVYAGENRVNLEEDEQLKRLARTRSVEVVAVREDGLRLMNKMSEGRPHNGYVLEASALPVYPTTGLLRIDGPNERLVAVLDHQSKEEIAVNGLDPYIRYKTSFPRYPLLLMLDSILDPGNLGAIIRSAHFLGANGIIYSKRNCAPLSAVALKASAGASETLPLISVLNPRAFIDQAQDKGWSFYAAAASQHQAMGQQKLLTTSDVGCPVRDRPCIVMVGSEGTGLNLSLLKKADNLLTIEGQGKDQGGVDSLNVSVAAALLCEAMLRRPPAVAQPRGGDDEANIIFEDDEEAAESITTRTPRDLF